MFNTNNDSNLKYMFGLVLWCLTPLSTIFQLFRGGQFLMVEETGRSREKHRPAKYTKVFKIQIFLFAKVVQKMCFDDKLHYIRYMYNLNYFQFSHSNQGRHQEVRGTMLFFVKPALLLCVLEQPRVNNSSAGPSSQHLAQMALLRPVLIFTHYIFISTSAFLRTWSITIIILAKGLSEGVAVYLITTECCRFFFYTIGYHRNYSGRWHVATMSASKSTSLMRDFTSLSEFDLMFMFAVKSYLHSWCFQCSPRPISNCFTVFAWITDSGGLFHISTILLNDEGIFSHIQSTCFYLHLLAMSPCI